MCAYFYRFSLLSLLPFAAFAILKLGTGGRGDFIAGAAMLMILYLYDKRLNWPNWRSVVAALGALLVFTTVVQDRGAGVRELFGIEGVNETRVGGQDFTKPLEHMDFANLESFEFVVYAVPARTGSYDYFLHNLRILTEPIPRALWKEKPMGDPVRLFYLYDHGNFIAMALGVPAVGWYSLGYLGVVLWAALFAYIYASAYRRFNRSYQSNIALLAYAILLSTTIVAFRDGMLLTIVKLLLAYGLPLVLLWAIVRVFAPQLLRTPTQPEQKGGIGAAHRPRARRYTGSRTIPRAWRA